MTKECKGLGYAIVNAPVGTEEKLAENILTCDECDGGYNTVECNLKPKLIKFVDDRKINPSFWDHIRKIK